MLKAGNINGSCLGVPIGALEALRFIDPSETLVPLLLVLNPSIVFGPRFWPERKNMRTGSIKKPAWDPHDCFSGGRGWKAQFLLRGDKM